MDKTEALAILKALADGIDPLTAERFPSGSPYQKADTVRALHVAIASLEESPKITAKSKAVPENAGKPWTSREDEELLIAFDDEVAIPELARIHKRTVGSIRSRLVKLGRLEP
jgi:hypothetical protein